MQAEIQKAADAADISVLFFSAGANFWAILAISGNFWAILGNFWAILGHFWAIFGANFCWPKVYLCYFYYFLHLCSKPAFKSISGEWQQLGWIEKCKLIPMNILVLIRV